MTSFPKWRVPKFAPIIVAGAVALGVVGAGGYWLGANRSNGAAPEGQRQVLYWYDPMRPEVHFDRPGRSPFMAMDLVPRYADETQGEAGVRIDPGVAQNLGVRLATVERSTIARSVLAAGVIAFNERNVAIVQARAGGFVERMHGRAVGDVVAAGAPIVDIRVPEWAAAQAEYLALRSAGGDLAQAARRRLAMLGMPTSLIERVEREGTPRPVFTVVAPISGAITALDIRQGMMVTPGAPIATINGLSPVWLVASLPQADAALARHGASVVATLPAYAGETFSGRIESVLPAADAATRSIEVRIALANPQGRLRPGMTAEVRLNERAQPALVVPSEAVIRTGTRSIVIVVRDDGGYAPVEVGLGRQQANQVEISTGLTEGQRVVASGQFLIDSEASLSGVVARLNASRGGDQAATVGGLHETTGRITAIDGEVLTIAHGPVASLNWPSMTMNFRLARPELGRALALGNSVAFRFRESDGAYVIEDIRPAGPTP
ncbi:MAG: efflux RND transporter periplasmic adaptor subunit [Hyphomonadaceae bacterium]|jgi:Cu(I)/Ag(I) efflux system membrane fusion protein|nr:efflux RND transporter periplasmic adaptor subunit [Hyphomonadaceae bacterium]